MCPASEDAPVRLFGVHSAYERERLERLAGFPGVVRPLVGLAGGGVVAAFDAARGGVFAPEACGEDPGAGQRIYSTGLLAHEVGKSLSFLADDLHRTIPAGPRAAGLVRLDVPRMNRVLRDGASWAVMQGHGWGADLLRIEGKGRGEGGDPEAIPTSMRRDHLRELGTLGTGAHGIDLLAVEEIDDAAAAEAEGIAPGSVLLVVRSGTLSLGRRVMALLAEAGVVPLESPEGRRALQAVGAATNFALANRQIVGTLAMRSLQRCVRGASAALRADRVADSLRTERHPDGGGAPLVFHRRRAYRIGDAPLALGGGLGTPQRLLRAAGGARLSFHSSSAAPDRLFPEEVAAEHWTEREVGRELRRRGVELRAATPDAVVAHSPWSYMDPDGALDALQAADVVSTVCRLRPLLTIRG